MSNIPANFTDGSFTITDDAGTPNSATLLMSQGDLSFSGLVPDGREVIVSQSRGATVGIRKGARAYPTISVSAILAGPSAAFQMLALGETAGFVSTADDLGDYATVDFDFSFDFGAETRDITGEDAILTSVEITEGETSTISFSFQIAGPVSFDGTAVVSAR
tara:strand:+ start:378 stop:863 length:486 start_codon:yes stop_codon:yes gene_type:complete